MRRHSNLEKTRLPQPKNRRAYALVSALMAIVLLTVMVVAFVSNAGTDRQSTNSYKMTFLAEQALEAGLESAKVQLLKGTKNDHFIISKSENTSSVLANPSPAKATATYYYVGVGTGAPSPYQVKYIPLFSGADETSTALIGSPLTLKPPVSPAFITGLDLSGSKLPTQPTWMNHTQTAWVDVNPDASKNTPKLRYTYWIEDMGGYLDANIVGNNRDSGGKHKRTFLGEIAADEVAFYTIFDKTNPLDAVTVDDRFENLKGVFSGGSPIPLAVRDDLKAPLDKFATKPNIDIIKAKQDFLQQNLVSGLRYDSEQEVVPFYPPLQKSGEPKVALNDMVTAGGDQSVTDIATRISTAIPGFAARRGGFSPAGVSGSTQQVS